jgi:formylglycine-generating enzyme required for sulfatase activity
MAGKIFVNYRRDDERAMAARIRDRLAATFGDANIFMDVDNLLAGQRFDKELEKALNQTDVFLAVIGPRWVELLAERRASGERDYVREEIAGALQRDIVVIPILIERTPLPRADALPQDICDFVLHQKHIITHEQFGRDVVGLVEAIRFGRKAARAGGGGSTVRWVGTAALAALVLSGGLFAHQMGAPGEKKNRPVTDPELIERLNAAAEQEKAKRAAEGAERQRVAMLKAEEDRERAKAAAKRKADEEATQRDPALSVKPGSGRSFRDRLADGQPCPMCPEMVVVPPGEFMMGSPPGEPDRESDEGPQRKVTIARPFAVGKFETTFAEWDACVADGGCRHRPKDFGRGRGRQPVVDVSWHDAKEYAAWLSHKTSKTYGLLSEAEWEYAARAGTSTRFAFGNTITKSQAQYSEGTFASAGGTMEVGSFPANRFGLHDMHGNAWEWVEDAWRPNYRGAPTDGSVWQGGDSSYRVLRGGSWFVDADLLRSAERTRNPPDTRYGLTGFRLARAL